ncbi:vomeronasal 2 receptor, 48 precursor [Rattus norvegicus]|uniref:Parathyroid cell calcium-sensing receptor n=2 Tax=Rattus norvegicus TaxID=10116 RepID=D3ZSU0_RAT|nr:vomeronasal 2 receptor, 48 precursor [Rattus norvegicus]|eukprot:NP_001092984.1 vomeronasal 2 receptor, 48 precursor [Rattus norvegicus]
MKLLIVFSLLIVLIVFQVQISYVSLNNPASPGYYQDGDFVIGGLFSLRMTTGDTRSKLFDFKDAIYLPEYVYGYLTKHYQHMLAMIFAIEKINKDPNILFNMSLGFYLFNVDFIEKKAIESSMALLSGESPPVPNYSCRPEKTDKLVAVIGGISTGISTQISRVLSLYNIPQISYAPFDHSLGTRVQLQSPYQFPMHTTALYHGIIQLLLYFTWVWVGMVVTDDMRGELFLRDITEEMNNHGLCVAFVEKIPEFSAQDRVTKKAFMERYTSTRVIVGFGDTYSLLRFVSSIIFHTNFGNVWITTSYWDFTILPFYQFISRALFSVGRLSFSVRMDQILGFKDFLRSVQPRKYPHDIFLQDVWSILFKCPYSYQHGVRILTQCEQNGTLSTRPLHVWDMNTLPPSYKVHAAVYAIAQALHEELSLGMEGDSFTKCVPQTHLPWKLHPFLQKGKLWRRTNQENIINKEVLATVFDIFNSQSLQKGNEVQVQVGEFVFESHSVQHFSLNEKLITWPRNQKEIPLSLCSQSCPLGFRKTPVEGKPSCCFDCLPCPDGEIANETDMDQCIKCPEDQYPNKQRNQCLPKITAFLSCEDPLGAVLVSVAISLSAFSAMILGLFIHYRDTPIVRANNRNLSYLLLVSLMLCFFCSLIFICQPTTVTCILRQMIFGVVFSITISAILAKTFIVVVAFKVIKPGSTLQTWMVTRVSNAIVCCGSSIQVCICAVWLGTYPPFPDVDMQSEFGQIILWCNEGSTLAFYCVLGYLGFLASLSLLIAFLARRLPDTFNEAKTITFSMLVFCSVWISFVPTYLSSKGKTMVAVEILSILASSSTLLGCIFLPKCYVILMRSGGHSRKKIFK